VNILDAIMPLILAAGGIVLVDLVLSGDNALVIGAAAGRLPPAQRLQAIFLGGLGAIVFRAALAIGATELLLVPLLQAIGGVVLVVIAIRLVLPDGADDGAGRRQSDKLLPAVFTILVADLTMSLDNVLAVGALAHGNLLLLVLGLLFSMTLLFVASALVAQLISRFTWLIGLAAGVLAYTAANLIIGDPIVSPLLHLRMGSQGPTTIWALALQSALVVVVLAFAVIMLTRQGRQRMRARDAKGTPLTSAVEGTAAAPAGNSYTASRSPNGAGPQGTVLGPGALAVDDMSGVEEAGSDGDATQAEMQRAALTPEEAEA